MADFTDKTFLKSLRVDIDSALQEVARKHGISLKAENISYSDGYASIKLEAKNTDAQGIGGKEAEAYKRNAAFYGMRPEWLGKPFADGVSSAMIIGMKPGNKLPLIIRGARGTTIHRIEGALELIKRTPSAQLDAGGKLIDW